MSIKTPRLIRDRCGVYYFRFLVPLHWRETVGKAEIRRSLRTKDAATARHAALLLSARMEALMVDRKFLTNPTLADFAHLTGRAPDIRQKIRIDLDKGIVETDTMEEAKEARGMVEDMAKARLAMRATVAELPSSKCGTNLEQAAADFLVERKTTLSEKGTIPKFKGVLRAFTAFAGNLDVAMVQAVQVKNYKKKLLAEKNAPRPSTTIWWCWLDFLITASTTSSRGCKTRPVACSFPAPTTKPNRISRSRTRSWRKYLPLALTSNA